MPVLTKCEQCNNYPEFVVRKIILDCEGGFVRQLIKVFCKSCAEISPNTVIIAYYNYKDLSVGRI